MKQLLRKRRQIALGLCIALLSGLFFGPMQGVASANSFTESTAATRGNIIANNQMTMGENTFTNNQMATRGAVQTTAPTATQSVTPAVTQSATPGATQSATPGATTTPSPYMTPNPNATLRLGDNSVDLKMTVGDKGILDIDWNNTEEFSAYVLAKLMEIEYESDNSAILSVSENGEYEAKSMGKTQISVSGYGKGGSFYRTYNVLVFPNMTSVTLEKDSATIYLVEGSYYYNSEVEIKLQGDVDIDSNSDFSEDDIMQVVSSNPDMSVDVSLSKNKLILSCDSTGSTKLTITIYGKEYTFNLKVVSVKLTESSVLLAKKQTKKLKIKGYSGKITWKSSRKKVASVSANGKIKAKKEGNTIISAKIGDCKVGCVVSVTNARKKKVIKRAVNIAKTGKYSQPKRMQKGFYDCSSLTWRSYSKYGYSLGGSGYAPTAASQGQWLAGKKKLIKGGLNKKNIENLKLNAGDLFFETGAKNGRFKGIYHVEMIIGYEFYGFDSDGDPMVVVKWANRPDGYYGYAGGIVGRP